MIVFEAFKIKTFQCVKAKDMHVLNVSMMIFYNFQLFPAFLVYLKLSLCCL